jgi:hypothetical protein
VVEALRTIEVNLALLQAQAFLEGRLDLPEAAHDVAVVNGHYYMPFPPLPAIVLLPLAAVRAHPNSVLLVAAVLAAVCFRLLRSIFTALGCTPEQVRWLSAAFVAGTGFWLVVLWSRGVWHFAIVVGVTCALAAIDEVLRRGRAWVVGLFAGLAVLSRQLAIYNLLFLLPVLWSHPRHTERRDRVLSVGIAMTVFGALATTYPLFNWLRFGVPGETGYGFIRHAEHLAPRVAEHGLFSLAYVPVNAIHLFLEGPHVIFTGADLMTIAGPDPFGTSLTFASPFLFLALAARGRFPVVVGAAAGAAVCLAHQLLYHTNGWVQWNAQRYTLDFIPLLMVLVALAVQRIDARIWKSLIAYAIGLNFLMLFVVPNLNRLLP